MSSITPGLIEALSASSKAELLGKVAESMSPYAIANGESVSETVNRLVRGTSLENLIDDVNINV